MHTRMLVERRVLLIDGQILIHVEPGRGEELQLHLLSHGIQARIVRTLEVPYERLEVKDGTDPDILQAIVDEWEQ